MPRFIDISGAAPITAAVDAQEAIDVRGRQNTIPVFTVSTYFGGTLGEGDDTACIQATLDAAHEAGGGYVVLPPHIVDSAAEADSTGPYYYASQLVIPDWVHFTGSGWFSLGLGGEWARLRQTDGVNDDFIIFDPGDDTSTYPFQLFGLSDLVLRGAASTTGGHAINMRKSDGGRVAFMDSCTMERLTIRGFYESAIYIRKSSPLTIRDVTTLWNGGYGVEIYDDFIEDPIASHSQVTLNNISGDGNMGYEADAGGATVHLNGLQTSCSVVMSGIKSEYRVRPTNSGGDGTSMGNVHCIEIEDCTAPITVHCASHIASASTTYNPSLRKPGNVIEIIGPGHPNLSWSSLSVRVLATQSGTDPTLVYNNITSRGINCAQGFAPSSIGASGTERGLQIEHKVDQSGTAGFHSLGVNAITTTTGSGATNLLHCATNGSGKFHVDDTGRVTANQGYYVGGNADTLLTRSSAGRVDLSGNLVADAVDVPLDLTSGITTMHRNDDMTGQLTSAGSLRFTYFTPRETVTVASVRTISGSQAAVGSTLCKVGIYTVDEAGDMTLVASTANTTSLWSSTNTRYTTALSSPYEVVRGTRYAVATLCVGASTAPYIVGLGNGNADELAEAPRLCGALFSQTDLPASPTEASLTDVTTRIYVALIP